MRRILTIGAALIAALAIPALAMYAAGAYTGYPAAAKAAVETVPMSLFLATLSIGSWFICVREGKGIAWFSAVVVATGACGGGMDLFALLSHPDMFPNIGAVGLLWGALVSVPSSALLHFLNSGAAPAKA